MMTGIFLRRKGKIKTLKLLIIIFGALLLGGILLLVK